MVQLFVIARVQSDVMVHLGLSLPLPHHSEDIIKGSKEEIAFSSVLYYLDFPLCFVHGRVMTAGRLGRRLQRATRR